MAVVLSTQRDTTQIQKTLAKAFRKLYGDQMDPNELGDLFESMSNETTPVDQRTEPSEPKTKTEESESTTDVQETNTQTEEVASEESTEKSTEETESTESGTLKSSEEQETKTETEAFDWRKDLKAPPTLYELKAPEVDENGNIVNMTAEEYENYIIGKAQNNFAQTQYRNYVENAALDAAEQILPEIKTDPVVRQLVENQRIAQVVNGQEGDVVQAAQQIKQLLGHAKSAGAQSAKTSITIQKNAAVESGATNRGTEVSDSDKLFKKARTGDEDALVDLLGFWEKEGKL